MFSITIIIMIITAVTSFMAFNNPALKSKMLFVPYLIKKDGEYHRFLSSGLIHADFWHLGLNMWVLYFFGTNVEIAFNHYFGSLGNLFYVLLYVIGIVAAGLPSFFKHKDHSYYRALGASGAVSAVLYSAILMDPLNPIYLMFIPIPIYGFVFGILYLAYEFYASKRQTNDGIGHDAHFFGAVFGVLFTLALKPAFGPNFMREVLSIIG